MIQNKNQTLFNLFPTCVQQAHHILHQMETSFKQATREVHNRKARNCRGVTGRSESHERNGATRGNIVFTPELHLSLVYYDMDGVVCGLIRVIGVSLSLLRLSFFKYHRVTRGHHHD